MTTSEGVAAPKATRREWIGLGVLAIGALMYVMDLTVLHLAVPKLSADLRPTSTELLWILDIYGFFVAGCLVTMGTLGDRIGRRKLLMIGAGAFALTSVLFFGRGRSAGIARPDPAARARVLLMALLDHGNCSWGPAVGP